MALISRLPSGSGTRIKDAKYLWAKFDSTGETLIELLVDTDSEAYSEGLGVDGYYYQRIVYVIGADNVGTYLLEL